MRKPYWQYCYRVRNAAGGYGGMEAHSDDLGRAIKAAKRFSRCGDPYHIYAGSHVLLTIRPE